MGGCSRPGGCTMPGTDYRQIRIPDTGAPSLAHQLEKALFLARWANSLEGNRPRHPGVERNDALELIVATFLHDYEPVFQDWCSALEEKGGYAWARWQAQRRDNFRCLRCDHSRTNAGGVESHHMLPRSQGGTDDPRNLATLCSACHREITHPEDGEHRWHQVIPVLEAKIEANIQKNEAAGVKLLDGPPVGV